MTSNSSICIVSYNIFEKKSVSILLFCFSLLKTGIKILKQRSSIIIYIYGRINCKQDLFVYLFIYSLSLWRTNPSRRSTNKRPLKLFSLYLSLLLYISSIRFIKHDISTIENEIKKKFFLYVLFLFHSASLSNKEKKKNLIKCQKIN